MLKAVEEARALANALNGAIQQCDDFLQTVESDVGGDADSSIPQDDSKEEESKGSNK